MVLDQPGRLTLRDLPVPQPGFKQLLVRVRACAVCRTDLHVLDGELPDPKPSVVPGHEIVGVVAECGPDTDSFRPGERVGIPWMASTCGVCEYCISGRENLCPRALFTGYTRDGGFAEYALADEAFCLRLPDRFPDLEAAPLLCAGLIGYRSYKMTGPDVSRLGLYGFGAAAHIIAQVATADGKTVFAFTRPGDRDSQRFARALGVAWVGDSDQLPPAPLDAAIIFAPVGALVPLALSAVRSGGVVVCGGIHMSDIPSFPYRLLWQERSIRSVANLTRLDGEQFMQVLAAVDVRTTVTPLPLADANEALARLRSGRVEGALVLVP